MPQQDNAFVGGAPRTLDESEVVALARQHTFGLPVGFFVGMAYRESGFTANQVDTDYDKEGNPRDAKTYGLLMLRRDEAAKALGLAETLAPESTLIDPATNLRIGAQVFARYKSALELAAGQRGDSPYYAEELAAYVGLAHNWGLSRQVKSVLSYGIDWPTFAARNATEWPRQVRYGNTIIEYVKKYPDVGGGFDAWWLKAGVVALLVYLAFNPGMAERLVPA